MSKDFLSISILGSTGSIGTQALQVAKNLGISVAAISANKSITLLEEQARIFNPKLVAVYDEDAAEVLRERLRDLSIRVVSGMDGLCEVACIDEADLVLNSVVGQVGFLPTLKAIQCKKDIALANKETLVVAGELIISEVKKNGVKLLPVDSEHSAIFQCLEGCKDRSALSKLILTASGGPFFCKTIDELKHVTVQQALDHPTWNMGAKITIDSATMMNKGLEIIEAAWLFDMDEKDIDVVIHRESIVHSMIEYVDGSVISQMGVPDMRVSIQYAFTYPDRVESEVERLSLSKIQQLSFYEPDYKTFRCMTLCKEAFKAGGTAPAIANAANEEAVKLFLNGEISFLDIPDLIEKALEKIESKKINSLEDIILADKQSRKFVRGDVNGIDIL